MSWLLGLALALSVTANVLAIIAFVMARKVLRALVNTRFPLDVKPVPGTPFITSKAWREGKA